MILELLILPAFFICVNVFPALHITKGAIKDKSNTVWVAWFLGYYLLYNSVIAPFALAMTNVLGMRKLYYFSAAVAVGALTNPKKPMLTLVFTRLLNKLIALWKPAKDISNHLWCIAEILVQPINAFIVFALHFLQGNIPGWKEHVDPLLTKLLDWTESGHREDSVGSPKRAMTNATLEVKENLKADDKADEKKGD